MNKTYKVVWILMSVIGWILPCLSSKLPIVRVDSGQIAGSYGNTYNGRQFYSFLGIPYARPPVQDYRFKEPQPVKPWLGIWNATIPGSKCLGLDFRTSIIVGQEDCLFINVYTPKLPQDNALENLMNVVVYIHGGAFLAGQGIDFGPHYLLDHNDFVYVSINYRLGVLGFAATGDDILPGNNGLKDQVAALKWIKQNIRAFGGNPNSVTITGMSAGASSVHYHLISPLSHGLFNRAILQSGSAFCPWAFTENVTQKTLYVAKILGCSTDNSVDIVKCLLSRPANQIAGSVKHFMTWRNNPFTPFGPTVEPVGEKRFLPVIPEKLVPYDVPVLMSVTRDEGLDTILPLVLNKNASNELNNNWNEYIPLLLDYNHTISNDSLRATIAQDIKEFYLGNDIVSIKTKNDLVRMTSDRMFGYAMSAAAKHIASKNTASVFFHEFGYSGEYSYLIDKGHSRGSGVSHGDETLYILKNTNKSPHDNEEDTKMIKIMVHIWASFINNGAPDVGSTVHWLPLSTNPLDPLRLMQITQNQTFEPKEISNYGNYAFWSSLPLTEFYNKKNNFIHTEL